MFLSFGWTDPLQEVKIREEKEDGEYYKYTKKTGCPYILCAHQPLSQSHPPFSNHCHDSAARRLYKVSSYGKKDMCTLEVSHEVLSGLSPWISLINSWLHDSCFCEIRNESCVMWVAVKQVKQDLESCSVYWQLSQGLNRQKWQHFPCSSALHILYIPLKCHWIPDRKLWMPLMNGQIHRLIDMSLQCQKTPVSIQIQVSNEKQITAGMRLHLYGSRTSQIINIHTTDLYILVDMANIWLWGWLILHLTNLYITEQSLPSSTPRPPLQPSVLHSGHGDSPSWLPLSAPASTPAPGTSCECAGTSSRPYWNGRHPTRFSLKLQNWHSFFWGCRQDKYLPVSLCEPSDLLFIVPPVGGAVCESCAQWVMD